MNIFELIELIEIEIKFRYESTLSNIIRMSHNFSEVCLTPQQMRMYGNEAEKYLQRYFYPCVVLFGLAGNLLNLTVLLNKSMRSR